MESKKQSAYEAMFAAINQKWVELDCVPKMKKFLVDFEAGEMGAVASVFGTDKVCFYQQITVFYRLALASFFRCVDAFFIAVTPYFVKSAKKGSFGTRTEISVKEISFGFGSAKSLRFQCYRSVIYFAFKTNRALN